MLYLKDKVIVTDIDGVVLDWNYGFEWWLYKNGHSSEFPEDYDRGSGHKNSVKNLDHASEFCKSPFIGKLFPYKDAVKYIRLLHEQGYVFHAITAIDPAFTEIRRENLERYFGKNVFEEVMCSGNLSNKRAFLDIYKDTGCYWLEDSITNANDGNDYGLTSVIFEHSYNKDRIGDQSRNHIIVSDWKQFYNHVMGY